MRGTVAAVAYLAAMVALVYGFFDRGDAGLWVVPVLVALQFGLGFAAGRWWALFLPVLVVLISIPAGYPPITPEDAEPLPLWFPLGVGLVVAVPLVGVGSILRWIYERRLAPEQS
jgi:hypothetical protein